MTGNVIWFNKAKGFGFIKPDNGTEDVFVHHTAILMKGYRSLVTDQRVEYDIELGQNGRRQASEVKVL